MANNVSIKDAASATVAIVTEDIGSGVEMPVSKIHTGAAGVDGGAVTATNPLAVEVSDGTNVLGTSSHPIRTDPTGGTTQPVSGTVAVTGTFWQTTQPVSGTFFQATQPVSAAALPLPSGAATLAKQPALGTAGTASADVLSVQGITSMTALKVDGSAVTQPVSGTFWQATQPVSGTFFQATQPVSAAALPLPSGAATLAKQPALGTAGTASADVITVQGITSMTALKVDGSGVTQPVSGTVAVTGTFFQATQPVSVASTLNTTLLPATSGGLSIYRNISLLATGISVKGSAGQLYGYFIYNNASSVRFIKIYDKASAPTVGTDTPVLTLAIPAGAAANVSHPNGVAFTLGIGIGATTLIADNDTTAPSANDCVVNLYYK